MIPEPVRAAAAIIFALWSLVSLWWWITRRWPEGVIPRYLGKATVYLLAAQGFLLWFGVTLIPNIWPEGKLRGQQAAEYLESLPHDP